VLGSPAFALVPARIFSGVDGGNYAVIIWNVDAPTFAMPLVETEAIVLRTYRLGEADKIASLLTRQMGRIRAVASGAQRSRSRYGGTLEPLSYVRIWVFERENRDLGRLNSAELIESFFDMQKDYAAQAAAQYLAEVCERLLPEREANDRVFRLLVAVLRGLKRGAGIDAPLVYFDYWFLRVAGFLPDFERCSACGRRLDDGYYGAGSEGLVCGVCHSPLTPRRIEREGLTLAEALRSSSPEAWWARKDPMARVRELRRFLQALIEFHAERKLITLEVLEQDAGG
jgi:DNA repair protein RecO (recombination protein O)